MSGLEVAGLVIGIVSLVAIIKEAHLQVKKHEQRRRIRTLGFGGGDTTSLANELQSSQLALTSRYNGFHDAYGRPFAQGDEIAIRQLSELLTQLQQGLTLALRNAQQAGKINNPYGLVRVTITDRTEAVSALVDLSQRVATAMPITSLPSPYGTRELARRSTRLLSYSRYEPPLDPFKSSYEPYRPSQSLQVNIEPFDTSASSLSGILGQPTRTLTGKSVKERRASAKRMGRFRCGLCNRNFGEMGSLNQHRDSLGHKAKAGYGG